MIMRTRGLPYATREKGAWDPSTFGINYEKRDGDGATRNTREGTTSMMQVIETFGRGGVKSSNSDQKLAV